MWQSSNDRLLVSVLALVTLLVPGGVTADTASQKFSASRRRAFRPDLLL
jgi:hypothetical protein